MQVRDLTGSTWWTRAARVPAKSPPRVPDRGEVVGSTPRNSSDPEEEAEEHGEQAERIRGIPSEHVDHEPSPVAVQCVKVGDQADYICVPKPLSRDSAPRLDDLRLDFRLDLSGTIATNCGVLLRRPASQSDITILDPQPHLPADHPSNHDLSAAPTQASGQAGPEETLSALQEMRDRHGRLQRGNREGLVKVVHQEAGAIAALARAVGWRMLALAAERVQRAAQGEMSRATGYVKRDVVYAVELHLDAAEALWHSSRYVA